MFRTEFCDKRPAVPIKYREKTQVRLALNANNDRMRVLGATRKQRYGTASLTSISTLQPCIDEAAAET